MTETLQAPVRNVDGATLPAAGTYNLDGSHSHVGFTVKHLMVAKVRGSFNTATATITNADEPTTSAVEVSIDASSIDTRDEGRDGHLRSGDFLDVEQFPALTFTSTSVSPKGDRWEVTGDLTIKDVTKSTVLTVEFEGGSVDPWGNARIGFSATGEINREEFGLTWNQALETGGFVVGKNIKLEIEAEGVKA